MLSQPLTQLFTRVKPANDAAQADMNASRANAQETQNEVALKVHQIYYQLLIAQLRRSATAAKIRADQDLEGERVEQVKYGSELNEALIESRAQLLEAKQDLLTTELQISDLTMQLDDVMGLPVTTQLTLDSEVPAVQETCARQECVKIALESHPEVVAAREEVTKGFRGRAFGEGRLFPGYCRFRAIQLSEMTSHFSRVTSGPSEPHSTMTSLTEAGGARPWGKAIPSSRRPGKTSRALQTTWNSGSRRP